MSIENEGIHTSEQIINFYSDHLEKYGNSSQGVGWKNDDAQNIRFQQLTQILIRKENFTINDLGCGTGKYFKFLSSEGFLPTCYIGYDILDEMIAAAKEELPLDPKIKLKKIRDSSEIEPADFTVASGIFNVKYDAKESDWLHNILTTLDAMNNSSKLGFSFNLLTKYSDKEYMQAYLYYADPLFLFDYCMRHFSRNVALLHDYNQYDFTILVRKS